MSCPLLDEKWCIESECDWWDSEGEVCTIVSIHKHLRLIDAGIDFIIKLLKKGASQ